MLHNPNWERRSRVSQILSEAADLIEKHGHVKFLLGSKNGGMCVNGAIIEAVDSDIKEFNLATDAMAEHLGFGSYDSSAHTAEWNNKPERTAAEVIDALRVAAFANEKVG